MTVDATRRFFGIVVRYYVLCMFVAVLTLAAFLKVLVPELKAGELDYRLAVLAVVNGALVAVVVWLFSRRGGFQERRMKALVAFTAGVMAVLSFLAGWGVVCLAAVTLALLWFNIRAFLRRLVRFLEPGHYPSWRDVGTVGHLFATMLAAFTLINLSIGYFHNYFPDKPVAFTSSSVQVEGLVDYLYFSIVVMTTLGFGDIAPATPVAKLVVAMECLTSYVLFALMLGVITRGIVRPGKDGAES
jgi:voltage-gated potassium channel